MQTTRQKHQCPGCGAALTSASRLEHDSSVQLPVVQTAPNGDWILTSSIEEALIDAYSTQAMLRYVFTTWCGAHRLVLMGLQHMYELVAFVASTYAQCPRTSMATTAWSATVPPAHRNCSHAEPPWCTLYHNFWCSSFAGLPWMGLAQSTSCCNQSILAWSSRFPKSALYQGGMQHQPYTSWPALHHA